MNRTILFAVVLFILSSSMVSAEEYPYILKGIRPMGMGGAFVAISNDANALFYNPAGLSYVPEKHGPQLSIKLEATSQAYGVYKDALKTDSDNLQETGDFLRDHIGEFSHAGVEVFPHYERPHFAMGIYGAGRSNLLAKNYENPSLALDLIEDAGAAVGYARSFFEDSLTMGASVKYDMRKSLNKEYSLPQITSSDFRKTVRDDLADGGGALLDLGVIYRFDSIKWDKDKVTFQTGLSVNNLIGSELGDAEDLKPHADLGFSVIYNTTTIAFDYVDVTHSFEQDDDNGKRIRVGVEYIHEGYLALRAGVYQGYPTFGIGINGKHAQLDLLTYAEEVGSYAGQQKDRRYAIGLGFGF